MAKIHLAPLDPSREFVAQRDFLCRGRTYRKNDQFDPESVTKRTLRLLYEGRSIGYPEDGPTLQTLGRAKPRPPKLSIVPNDPPAPDRVSEPAPVKTGMTEAEKADLLAGNNRQQLVQIAVKAGIDVTARMGKRELVSEIARVRDAASHG